MYRRTAVLLVPRSQSNGEAQSSGVDGWLLCLYNGCLFQQNRPLLQYYANFTIPPPGSTDVCSTRTLADSQKMTVDSSKRDVFKGQSSCCSDRKIYTTNALIGQSVLDFALHRRHRKGYTVKSNQLSLFKIYANLLPQNVFSFSSNLSSAPSYRLHS